MRLTRFTAGAAWQLVCLLLISTSLAAPPENDVAFVHRTEFKHPPSQIAYFEDSATILMLIKSAGILRISTDGGEKWGFIEGPNKQEDIIGLEMSPNDKNTAIAVGANNRHWITFDRAETWTSFKTEKVINSFKAPPISWHADDPMKIILNTFDPNESFRAPAALEAIYTTDGFKTVKSLRKGAAQCVWAKSRPEFDTGDKDHNDNRILCTAEGPHGPNERDYRLLISDNYFDSEKEPNMEGNQPVPGIVSMVSATKFIMAARRAEGTAEMGLYTTNDTNTWNRALFSQQRVDFDGYTVLESTNHSIRIDVLASLPSPLSDTNFGALFQSNSDGTRFTRANKDVYTNRSPYGFVDFEQLANVEGVVLINAVSNAEQVNGRGDEKIIKTMISFDDARSFKPLKIKDSDKDLHLHSVTDLHNSGRVFSSPAPGIMLGVGRPGNSLDEYDKCDTYVSNDGGVTWALALFGPHKFEFGDSGSIKVAAYDKGSIDKISYAFKDAIDGDWRDLHIAVPTVDDNGDKKDDGGKFSPKILTTMPDSTGMRFILQATEGRGSATKNVVYTIDFSRANKEKCGSDDFEEWTAADGKCIMGHKQVFRRRKPNADCFVMNRFHEPLPDQSKTCECTDADYECDFEFVRDANSQDKLKCMPSSEFKRPKGACTNGAKTYKGPSGYRKIPGNTCEGGKKFDNENEWPCDGSDQPPAPDGSISVERTRFKDRHADGFREYYYLDKTQNDDAEVVVMTLEGSNELFTTRDHGKQWTPRRDEVGGKEVVRIILNKNEHNNAYFITPSKTVYWTNDRAQTIKNFDAPSLPRIQYGGPLRFHEKHSNWLIWLGCSDQSTAGHCDPRAWYSKRNGMDWQPMLDSVENCEFVYRSDRGHREEDEDVVYCTQFKGGRAADTKLVMSKDYFQRPETVREDILNFATMSEFLIVARKDEKGRFLELEASIDAKTFADAKFPHGFDVEPTAYTVLDSSTHAIFIHATTNGEMGSEYGTILKSNSNGTYFIKVLDNVNRNPGGYVDFEKAYNTEGVSILNRVNNIEEVNSGGRKKLQTYMSHNDGAQWLLIPAPETDGHNDYLCEGKPAVSQRAEGCSLNLHQYTERRDFRDTLSSSSGVGLMIGTGNVGPYLLPKKEENTDTFITNDGGVTWKTALKGQYQFEFGDQGALIVLVAEGRKTNRLFYSRDEGARWTEYEFSDEEIGVLDITTIPSDTALNFLIWADDEGTPVTFNVDFSRVPKRKCDGFDHPSEKIDADDGSDYYIWYPRHPGQEESDCVFGHRAKYIRKKPGSDCYNSAPITKPTDHKSVTCECVRQDFECAYNYERAQDGSCHKIAGLPDEDPKAVCSDPNVLEWHEASAYRKIPGDTCHGGSESLLGTVHACPGKEDEFRKSHRGISGVGLFFAIVIPIAAAAGIGYFVYSRYISKFGQIRLGDGGSPGLSTESPIIAWPITAVSAIAAAAMAIPGALAAVVRGLRERFGGRRRSSWRNAAYTSRSSFARGRGSYAAVGGEELENDLLGEDSDED